MKIEGDMNIENEEIRKIIEEVEQVKNKQEQTYAKTSIEQTENPILDALEKNEDGDKRLFIELNQGKYIYDHSAEKWFVWAQHYWEVDSTGKIYDGFTPVIQKYVEEAKHQALTKIEAIRNQNDSEKIKAEKLEINLSRRIHDLQTKRRKQNILFLASQGSNALTMSGAEWDLDPYLLGCSNGVIELKTGKFRPGQPEDYIKTVAPTDWLGIDTPAPMWEKFINEIFEGQEPLIKFVQRVFGYAIAGLTLEHILIILQGEDGRNGKGTMLETIKYVLGEVAWSIPIELLLRDPRGKLSSAASPEYAVLKGKRIVWASESQQGLPLGLAKVKLLTGADTISCRPLHKAPIDFTPTHTVFLLSNPCPKILEADDKAFWDRVHLIPFGVSFVAEPKESNEKLRDLNLPEKLKTEASGILAWLVRGFLEWQKIGLQPPDAVKRSTLEYRLHEDVVERFLRECTKVKNGSNIQASTLYDAYKTWADENNLPCMTKTAFGTFASKKLKKEPRKGGNYYLNICFLTHEENEKQEQEKMKS